MGRGDMRRRNVRGMQMTGRSFSRRGLMQGAAGLGNAARMPRGPGGPAGARHRGAIVAVAPAVAAPAAQVIDGAGMICIPGFVDTHFHLWNALFRLFVRADVPALGYFPVTARLGPLMAPA